MTMIFESLKYGMLLLISCLLITQSEAQVFRQVKPVRISGYSLNVAPLSQVQRDRLKSYVSKIPEAQKRSFDLEVRKIMLRKELSEKERAVAIYKLAEKYATSRVVIKKNNSSSNPSPIILAPDKTQTTTEKYTSGEKAGDTKPDKAGSVESDPDPSTPGNSDEAQFENVRNRLKGRLAYDVPDSMQVNRTSRVELAVSSGQLDETVAAGISNPDNPQFAAIWVGSKMTAELIDYDGTPSNPNFEIVRVGSFKEQSVEIADSIPTVWEWKVVPLKAGDHKLQVKVSVINYNEQTRQNDYRTLTPSFTREVTVSAVNRPRKRPSRVAFLLVLGGAVVLAGALVFLILRMRKKKSNSSQLGTLGVAALIEAGELNDAMELMKSEAIKQGDTESEKEILALDSRLSQLKKEVNSGLIAKPDERLERNRITVALIHLQEQLAGKLS